MEEEILYITGRSVSDEKQNTIKHPSTIQSWQDSIISPVCTRVFFFFFCGSTLIHVVSPQCESENNSVPVESHWCDSTSEISSKKSLMLWNNVCSEPRSRAAYFCPDTQNKITSIWCATNRTFSNCFLFTHTRLLSNLCSLFFFSLRLGTDLDHRASRWRSPALTLPGFLLLTSGRRTEKQRRLTKLAN